MSSSDQQMATLSSGESVHFRPLAETDGPLLAAYFEGLSLEVRAKYRPHDFTAEVAQQLCAQVGDDPSLRLIALTGEGENERIIAYFIVHRAISDDDQKRYAGYGVVLEPETDCQFAPSVADAYQGTGLGSRLMPLCQEIVRGQGFQRMMLWGGVYISNQQAVRFYEKNGFRVVGRFNPGGGKEDRYDMLASLV